MAEQNARATELAAKIERDGFVVVRDFFEPSLVAQARREIEQLYLTDLTERKRQNQPDPLFNGSHGKTILTNTTHLFLDLPGKSPALDKLMGKTFSDSVSSDLIKYIAGSGIKIRDVNCRLMTGQYDIGDHYNPPHEWHRDSPGEFCIGIFLSEVEPGGNAGTALVPGSHRHPWCPRWHALFGKPFYMNRQLQQGLTVLTRFNIFNRLLARSLRGATGAHGKPGDLYIFLNDTWHGREANVHGSKAMIVMAGGFPVDFPFPDAVAQRPRSVLDQLAPAYRSALEGDAPPDEAKTSLLHRLNRNRAKDRPGSLFWFARLERRLMERLSSVLLRAHHFVMNSLSG